MMKKKVLVINFLLSAFSHNLLPHSEHFISFQQSLTRRSSAVV